MIDASRERTQASHAGNRPTDRNDSAPVLVAGDGRNRPRGWLRRGRFVAYRLPLQASIPRNKFPGPLESRIVPGGLGEECGGVGESQQDGQYAASAGRFRN